MPFLEDVMRQSLRAAVQRIQINTTGYSWGVDDPFGPAKEGERSAALETLRPEIILIAPNGEVVWRIAPWGRPEEIEAPIKIGGVMVGLGLASLMFYGSYKLFTR